MNDPAQRHERELFRYRAALGRRQIEKMRARGAALAALPWNERQVEGQPPVFTETPPEGWDWNKYYKEKLGLSEEL